MKIEADTKMEDIVKVEKWKFSSIYGITKSPKGKALLIEPRLSKLLYFLSYNVNTNVSRNYLVNNIWADTIVNEESLTRAVSDLRKLLSENYQDSINIETIRGRGYKLSLKVEPKNYRYEVKINPKKFLILFGILLVLLILLMNFNILNIKVVT